MSFSGAEDDVSRVMDSVSVSFSKAGTCVQGVTGEQKRRHTTPRPSQVMSQDGHQRRAGWDQRSILGTVCCFPVLF